jgi:hypothetical protein
MTHIKKGEEERGQAREVPCPLNSNVVERKNTCTCSYAKWMQRWRGARLSLCFFWQWLIDSFSFPSQNSVWID